MPVEDARTMTTQRETPDVQDAGERAALERFVVDNDDLLALESLIGRFNIFDALKIARAEIRHSKFLAFLLDPAESHGQGALFLKAILMDLLKAAPPELRPLSPIELDGTDLRGATVETEWKNIDLLITCQEPPFVIGIENKIDSQEHSNQLVRYKAIVREHYLRLPPLFVYLTPDADDPSDSEWMPYSYTNIHGVLTRVLKTNRKSIGEDVQVFLDHYLNLIGTRFMNNPEIDALCQRIYKTHRQALDLIIERGKPESGVLAEAATILRDDPRWHVFTQTNNYILFVPKAWLDWLPSFGLEEDDPRSWIILCLHGKMLEFTVMVRSMKDPVNRKQIIQLLIAELPKLGFKKSRGGTGVDWARVSGADCVLERSEDEEPEPDIVRTAVKTKLDGVHHKLETVHTLLKPLLNLPDAAG
jgi:hypothetical protein